MKQNVKCEGHKTINVHCDACKGSCWVEGNQNETQKRAMEKFSIVPNHCVVSKGETPRCPYRNEVH